MPVDHRTDGALCVNVNKLEELENRGVGTYRIRLKVVGNGRGRRKKAAAGHRKVEVGDRRRRSVGAAEPLVRTRGNGPGKPAGSRGSRRCGCRSHRGHTARCDLGHRGLDRRWGPCTQPKFKKCYLRSWDTYAKVPTSSTFCNKLVYNRTQSLQHY